MEKCLERKTGCSSIRMTANIYTRVGKTKCTKTEGEWRENKRLSNSFVEVDLAIIGDHKLNLVSMF